jgi:uncharacterized protein (TIRG00374 family)
MAERATSKGRSASRAEKTAGGARWRQWFVALLLVGGLIAAALHWGDVKRFAALIAAARPLWLVVALLLQFLTYLSLSAEWASVLRAGGEPQPIWRFLPLTITKLFADQVIPTAGISGNMLLVDRLTRAGARREHSVAAVILAIIAYYASYAVCALAALVLLWLRHGLSWFLFALIGILLLVAAAIPAAAMWLQRKGSAAPPRWLRRSATAREFLELIGEAPERLVRNRRLIAWLALLNGAVFALDALTLQVCLFALGESARFDAAFVALIIASIVVTLGPIPLGLGSFEATSVAMLRLMGVPFETALSATLLYRGFALWLPLVGGMILARRELKRG